MNDTKWSNEQNAIFDWFRSGTGSLVVQARAGTGKTTTIKAAFEQAPEDQMLYAVFNKKNQVEAAAKITDPRVNVKTLHGVGFSYILGVWPGVKPDGFVERDRVSGGKDLPTEVVTAAVKLLSFAKNLLIDPTLEDLVQLADDRGIEVSRELEDCGYTPAKLARLAFDGLEASKVRDKRNRISFDDMVWLPVAQGWVRPRYDLAVIDEAQDMNLPQLTMARQSVRKGGRVCVVGDDRQAIYGFRGAVQDGLGMMKTVLNAATLPLSTTYRCPKAVVALANEIVPDYNAADSAPQGSVREANLDSVYSTVQVGDAILSRLNAPLMSICLRLLRNGVSARIEGRDIGKLLADTAKKLNARSVPDFLKRVSNWENRQIARAKTLKNKDARIQAVEDQAATLKAVAEDATGISEVLNRLDRLFQDTRVGERPQVVLSSVHKAKGLEWDRVFCLADTFRNHIDGEEANIRYVAYTRAKQELILLRGEESEA